jgi:polyhydroxybutyrate depolymerase
MACAVLLATVVSAQAVAAADGASPSAPGSGRPAGACRELAPGDQRLDIDVDGMRRQVLVHVPPAAAQPGARLPLVIAYHGYSAYAEERAESLGLGPVADEEGFVVVYPQGLRRGPWPPDWYFPGSPDPAPAGLDEIGFTEAMLDLAAAETCIDMERVIVVGHSKGGGMAEAAACAFSDRLAGAVLLSAVQFGIPCAPAAAIPIVALHALDDPVLPYGGGHIPGTPPEYPDVAPVEQGLAAWAGRNGCTSGPAITEQPDGGAMLAWVGCAAPVVLHRLATGGHDIPALAAGLVREMVVGPTDTPD